MFYLFNEEIKPQYATDNCILFNEDCRKVLENIKDESIDLFCSDIPYRIPHTGGGIKKERKKIYAVVCLIVLKIQKKTSIILKMGKYLPIMILK